MSDPSPDPETTPERYVHMLHVPTEEVTRRSDGARWCFRCRKVREFVYVKSVSVLDPDVPLQEQAGAYYGPTVQIECGTCHLMDGDCFPGTYREWGDGS